MSGVTNPEYIYVKIGYQELDTLAGDVDTPKSVPLQCQGCGNLIKGVYASIGGNWVPYIPSKVYHVNCVPLIRSSPEPEKPIQTPVVAPGKIINKNPPEFLDWLKAHFRGRADGVISFQHLDDLIAAYKAGQASELSSKDRL